MVLPPLRSLARSAAGPAGGLAPARAANNAKQYGLSPLPNPDEAVRGRAVTLQRQIVEVEEEKEEEEETEVAEQENEEDGHEKVCHGSGSTGILHCCSTCRRVLQS